MHTHLLLLLLQLRSLQRGHPACPLLSIAREEKFSATEPLPNNRDPGPYHWLGPAPGGCYILKAVEDLMMQTSVIKQNHAAEHNGGVRATKEHLVCRSRTTRRNACAHLCGTGLLPLHNQARVEDPVKRSLYISKGQSAHFLPRHSQRFT
jgi:hypothetical protein